jgi:uncharacterized protein YhaN
MRFAELDLIRYGRFEDCQLRFPQDRIDLQIVFGANEAGKSTTLAAISDLMFGFPHVTPYDFRFDKQLLRVGAVLQSEGVNLICRRKKGRTGTLLDVQDRVLDEGGLAAMLAGYSAGSFQRMFSLDHTRLRDGGRAILAAQDDIGQAIFAAGSGLVGVAALLESLEGESKEIWTKRAGDRRYYAAQHAYEEARARQKAAQIRPAAWDDLRQELGRLNAALANLRKRRGGLEREREEVERRRRVLPHAVVYRRAQTDLAPLAEVPDLPPDAGEILNKVAMSLATADAETALAEAECDQVCASLTAIVVDPRLIEHNDEIEALRETKGAVDKDLSDLPRRHADLAIRGRRLSEIQRELDWPEEKASTVKGRLPQRVRLAELRGLLEERSAIDATMSGAAADDAAARQALERLQTLLGELPPARDLGELSAALKFAHSLGDLKTVIRSAEREAGRRAAALSTSLALLAPWAGTVDELRSVALPSDSETATALAEVAQSELALSNAQRDHQAELDKKTMLELQRTHLVRDDRAVSLEAIQEARENRGALWRDLRTHLVDKHPLPDPEMAVGEFEHRSSVADDLADRRYTAAEQSARLTGLQEELEHNALSLAQHGRRQADEQVSAETTAGAWQALLLATGMQMQPKAFSAWSDRRRRALEAADEVDIAEVTLQEAQGRRDDAKARLENALAAVGAPAGSEQLFELLLQTAERLETTEIEATHGRGNLSAKVTVADDALKRAEAKQLAGGRVLAEWEGRWASAVAAAGLRAEQSHAVVRAQLELLEELRGDVDEILSLQQRVTTMQDDIAAFGDKVGALAAACGLKIDTRPPAELLVELAAAARDAAATQTRREGLVGQLATAKRRLADADTTRKRALGLLRPMSEAAGTADRGELAAAVGRSDRARQLRQDLNLLASEILKAGSGPTLDALLAESDIADAATLAVRSTGLQDELTSLSDEIASLTGDRATAQASFARLDDGPDAAIAASDAELARAEMAAQAEAYVRKRAEAALLRWTIARYRAEKQTPLLKRASSLFSKLTLGRYTELLVNLDADQARLAGLGHDKTVVPVEGMSDGTVDQLFLALRLAAVEDAVASGAKLPFLADDLFINYDDERARAGFQVLAELAQTTQVLFFTHHQHLVTLAEAALAPLNVSRCALN